MITSALIAECRREYGDQPVSVRVAKNGDGSVNTFNVGKFPIVESSYTVKRATSALTENSVSGYTINLDNGDILMADVPGNGVEVAVDYKYAFWRDKNWLEAINGAIQGLNARGFFKQVVRENLAISANVRTVAGPTDAIDVYELLYLPAGSNQNPVKLGSNWSYQQDANKLVLGVAQTSRLSGQVSYLRNLRTYNTTSATLDLDNAWIEAVKKRAAATFYHSMAGKVAKQGNATISEGHFSFSNLRAQAVDYDNEYKDLATRKKPTRPAKDIQYVVDGGGNA